MKLWKIALIFIAPLAIAPLVANAAGERDHPHHAAWQQEPTVGPRDHPHHAAWQQEPIVLSLRLGTEAGELKIIPNRLTLQAETPYKLVIRNPGEVAHVLALPEFSGTLQNGVRHTRSC